MSDKEKTVSNREQVAGLRIWGELKTLLTMRCAQFNRGMSQNVLFQREVDHENMEITCKVSPREQMLHVSYDAHLARISYSSAHPEKLHHVDVKALDPGTLALLHEGVGRTVEEVSALILNVLLSSSVPENNGSNPYLH